jgi:hypothetical protein
MEKANVSRRKSVIGAEDTILEYEEDSARFRRKMFPSCKCVKRWSAVNLKKDLLNRLQTEARVMIGLVMLTAALLQAQAQETGPVTVPMKLQGVHIYVEVGINGKPATFVLDTGASANVITPQAVERLKLTPGDQLTPVTGAAGQGGTVPQVKIANLNVGVTRQASQIAYVISLPEMFQCDGVLGTPFLLNQIVTIDYEHSQITMAPRKGFVPPVGATEFALRFPGGTPFLEANADGAKGWFRIDTGAGNGISLFAPFVEQHHMRGKYSPSIKLMTGRAIGGLLYGDIVRLPEFAIGPFKFTKPVTELSRQTEGAFADTSNAGNLGGELWQRFTVTLDYANFKIYLKPNARYDLPFLAPRSGLAVDMEKGASIIREVLPNSPGSEAGAVAGDVVLAVDGVPVEQIKPYELTALLRREPGTKVRLRLRSADKSEREVTLTLRNLI